MISTAALSPISSLRRKPSPMGSSISTRSGHWAGALLSPRGCGRSCCRARPSSAAAIGRGRESGLPGYTVVSDRDARVAVGRMLTRGPVRLKKPASASGRDQTVVATWNELDAALEKVTEDEMATYGLVLEENLRQVRTLSIGEIAVG